MIVADTQLSPYAATNSVNTQLALAGREKVGEWASPYLWRSEFRNALLGLMRTGVVEMGEGLIAFSVVSEWLSDHEYLVDTGRLLALSAGNRITAYDLELVTLAQELGVPLVTFDREVLRTFPALAVHPGDFVAA